MPSLHLPAGLRRLGFSRSLREDHPGETAMTVAAAWTVTVRVLQDPRSAEAGRRGLALLTTLFGPGGLGAEMAARAVAGLMDLAEVRLSCALLAEDLAVALKQS